MPGAFKGSVEKLKGFSSGGFGGGGGWFGLLLESHRECPKKLTNSQSHDGFLLKTKEKRSGV